MKQGSNQRRSRGRGNSGGGGRRGGRNQTFDSNGPDVKVRGTAQQVLDKYLQLARDAQSGGDRVKAEAYLQFAEHYYRIVNADQEGGERQPRQAQSDEGELGQQSEGKGKGEKPGRGRRRSSGNGNGKNEATLAAEAAARNVEGDDAGDEAEVEATVPAQQPAEDADADPEDAVA